MLRMGRSALVALVAALAGAAPAAAGEATAPRQRAPALPHEVQELVAGVLRGQAAGASCLGGLRAA